MNPIELNRTIDAISMAVVLADDNDVPAWRDIKNQFNELKGLGEQSGADIVERISAKALASTDVVVSGDSHGVSAAIEETKQLLEALQIYSGRGEQACMEMLASISLGDQRTAARKTVTIDPELKDGFIADFREHLENADQQLLTLASDPHSIEALSALFRFFHTIKGEAGFLSWDDLSVTAHTAEDLLDRVRCGEIMLTGTALEAAFESVDLVRHLISALEQSGVGGLEQTAGSHVEKLGAKIQGIGRGYGKPRKLGEILVDSGYITQETLCMALALQGAGARGPKVAPADSSETADGGECAARPNGNRSETETQCSRAAEFHHTDGIVKVDTHRLDQLLNMIGELGLEAAMLAHNPELLKHSSNQTRRGLAALSKTTKEVLKIGESMRMTSIRPVFRRMSRIAFDLAKKSGKSIELSTSGEEIELDRAIVENVGDALIHLIRNAIDHGIEDAETRMNSGKHPVGRLQLNASQNGGGVFLEIIDDGRGLDRALIRKKAVALNLAKPDGEMTDREIFKLIFAPGFSTTDRVTDISGRGVGMDVVKKRIESLRGDIDVRSIPGEGTQIGLHLPLTLAAIDGMIIRDNGERYIIPTFSVVEVISFLPSDITSVAGKGRLLRVRENQFAFMSLANLLERQNGSISSDIRLAVVVRHNGRKLSIGVDEMLGQQQIIVKNIEAGIETAKYISGAAVMPDGKVALVLDIAELIRLSV